MLLPVTSASIAPVTVICAERLSPKASNATSAVMSLTEEPGNARSRDLYS